ncbi:MAG: YidC/Oxa1 family insertase periplasmic-domain containing protein [Planctomycetota bacterium]
MKIKNILALIPVGFVIFCGILVVESGIFESSATDGKVILLQNTASQDKPVAEEKPASTDKNLQASSADAVKYGVDHAEAKVVTLGSTDPNSGFEFQLQLSSKGAAVKSATFSRFDDRDYKNPQPLKMLSPVEFPDGREILSMANTNFVFVEKQLQLPLHQLHWKTLPVKRRDGSQSVSFETVIVNRAGGKPVVKLTKTYKINPASYDVDCSLSIENLSTGEQKISFNLNGPVGVGREAVRADMRKTIACFRNSKGQLISPKDARKDIRKLAKAQTVEQRRLALDDGVFLWTAVINKYFAAVVVPLADEGKSRCDWLKDKLGRYYNPDNDTKANSGDETIGLDLKIASKPLAATGQPGSTGKYNFRIFVGPKDKRLFDKNDWYKNLGFIHTIDFMTCCCPAGLISPIAFGILTVMEWIYKVIPNYGVAIIILVFLIRIIIHPLTKKSQVSMSKFSKLAPKVEEIKKKYANNKTEMNKHVMALYKEQGASPFLGMVPMFVQMPIWISLYSAIYTSIALRGEPFLPFWITDLSAPDALIRFQEFSLPIFGKINSFNLLPILMGVAFYLQQKMMPSQASAATNPQMAQQQKMMKIMLPLMFPLMLYKAPSGLNLYIMASTFAGVIEQYVIRKHLKQQDQLESQGLVATTSKTGGKAKKKKPKPFYKNR